jgi:hypothetical protein
MRSRPHPRFRPTAHSAFAGYRFPPEVITLAVRWYLRFGLSYRDVEELLAERGIEVDHVTVYRWVHRFAPEFAEAARASRHIVGDRWHVDETYLRVGGDLALPVPGHRPVRPNHRCLPVTTPGRSRGTPLLRTSNRPTRVSPTEVTLTGTGSILASSTSCFRLPSTVWTPAPTTCSRPPRAPQGSTPRRCED